MSLKLFLKIYARLIAVAAAVILLCFVLFSAINPVRERIWQERTTTPLMQWLAAVPAPERQYHWMASLFGFQAAAPGRFDLSPVQAERLSYGQVVSEHSEAGQRFYALAEDGRVHRLQLQQPYRELARASALIARWHLDTSEATQRPDLAGHLEQSLNITLKPLQSADDLPGQALLDGLANKALVPFEQENGHQSLLFRLSSGELWQLSMPAPFNPWGWPVLVVMALVLGGVLALSLYLGLRFVDGQMRKVESVAVRMARGEMSARVEAGAGSVVSRLAASFNSMAEQIQRLVEVQREMIHAVSHELRTPVARIRFGVQMIESAKDPETLQKQLQGIDGDIEELDVLIDEILTYARLEQGGPVFTLREASVADIARQVVDEQSALHERIDIIFDMDEASEPWGEADVEPRYIHRAIQNLVGNAVRHARHQVRVTCRFDEDNCRVDVEDDGAGIPEEHWEKVFSAFARLDDSRTRTSGGYGLGLSIVRRILYWHGGQAFVGRSEQLGGARFSLVWPRRP